MIQGRKLTKEKMVVKVGSTVTFVDENGNEYTYTLSSGTESRSNEGRLSALSPLGKALLGSKVANEVIVSAPGGQYKVSIKKISVNVLE